MKQLTGKAQLDVSAPLEACYALLADVEHYGDWHPNVVRDVHVLDRSEDGLAAKAFATLHVALGPLAHDLPVTLAVERRPPQAVVLTRIPNEPDDPETFRAHWQLRRAGAVTQVGLDLVADLSLPRMLPLGPIGDAMAAGFVAAAAREVSRRG